MVVREQHGKDQTGLWVRPRCGGLRARYQEVQKIVTTAPSIKTPIIAYGTGTSWKAISQLPMAALQLTFRR